jgi:hypothetical protein
MPSNQCASRPGEVVRGRLRWWGIYRVPGQSPRARVDLVGLAGLGKAASYHAVELFDLDRGEFIFDRNEQLEVRNFEF